jgi:hypothetical protein
MYSEADDLSTCEKCGYKLDFGYINPKFRLKRKVYDLSFTYDHCCIVSLKFKEFCQREKYSGIKFGKFPLEPNYFYLTVESIVKFETIEEGIRYENLCEKCGNYESIVAPGPTFIKDAEEPLGDGLYRTDLVFGSGNEKNPLLIIGIETYKKLKREKFKGLVYDEIVVARQNSIRE